MNRLNPIDVMYINAQSQRKQISNFSCLILARQMPTTLRASVMPGSVVVPSHPYLSSNLFLLQIFFPNYLDVAFLLTSYKVEFLAHSFLSACIVVTFCYPSVPKCQINQKKNDFLLWLLLLFIILYNSSWLEDKYAEYNPLVYQLLVWASCAQSGVRYLG